MLYTVGLVVGVSTRRCQAKKYALLLLDSVMNASSVIEIKKSILPIDLKCNYSSLVFI